MMGGEIGIDSSGKGIALLVPAHLAKQTIKKLRRPQLRRQPEGVRI